MLYGLNLLSHTLMCCLGVQPILITFFSKPTLDHNLIPNAFLIYLGLSLISRKLKSLRYNILIKSVLCAVISYIVWEPNLIMITFLISCLRAKCTAHCNTEIYSRLSMPNGAFVFENSNHMT